MILINSVLANLPAYFLSLFPLPKAVEKKLDKKRRDFLWDNFDGAKKIHLVG